MQIRLSLAAFVVALLFAPPLVVAQNTPRPAPGEAAALSSDIHLSAVELETVMARIALYPDDLLAIILPASTYPMQVVQAARLLKRRKSDPNAQPPKSWDPSVVALLNYPEAVSLMSADIAWIRRLGMSMINQQDAVLNAIQAFRKRVENAGQLKSDRTQRVMTQAQTQTIVIEPTNPQAIYVPSYDPATVIYPPPIGATPPFYYYSSSYPPYWSPRAAFFTGASPGAAVVYALSWDDHGIYRGDVNINDSTKQPKRIRLSAENRWHPSEDAMARLREAAGKHGAAQATRPSADQTQGGPPAAATSGEDSGLGEALGGLDSDTDQGLHEALDGAGSGTGDSGGSGWPLAPARPDGATPSVSGVRAGAFQGVNRGGIAPGVVRGALGPGVGR